ncbi:MAG: hypothetical protein JO126_09330 [Alphaproteobacteria bacterium]|nr:hypothetical protein [Alphaproteobacteria bacterium]MBV8549643.1 hypothetical protein [Alphaproteobacteria bacterium]
MHDIALVITGSIAATKTLLLIKALRENGLSVAALSTPGPVAWGWVDVAKAESLTQHSLLCRDDITLEQLSAFCAAPCILIAPASAEILYQLAQNNTPLAQQINYAQGNGARLIITPAMNAHMWAHPAVQRNVAVLSQRGAVFLGPVDGPLACGDVGFGRMLAVEQIADAVSAVRDGHTHPASQMVDAPHLAPRATHQSLFATRPLIALAGKSATWPAISAFVKNLQSAGITADYVLGTDCALHRDALAALTGTLVCTDHFQIPTLNGMEHIHLPERATCVFFPFLDAAIAEQMVQGSAKDFTLCLALASKAPVYVAQAALNNLSQNVVGQLVADGVKGIDDFRALPADSKGRTAMQGKKILVLAGYPQEIVDSFRHYTNDRISFAEAWAAVTSLRDAGAAVTVIAPHAQKPIIEGVTGISTLANGQKIISARDLLQASLEYREKASADIVLQLAGLSSITCDRPVTYKIQKTGPERAQLFDVSGNINLIGHLTAAFPHAVVAGYDAFQRWHGDGQYIPIPVLDTPGIVPASAPAMPDIADDMAGRHVVVTTARTEEILTTSGDFITNYFSGKQGQDIAHALARRGAHVTLISGPTFLPDVEHPRITTRHVRSARAMLAVAEEVLLQDCDVFIGVAAVSDFCLPEPVDLRLAEGEAHTLALVENASIVGRAASHPTHRPPIVVSFAAQSPETVEAYATQKFKKLGANLTVANPIGAGTAIARDPSRNQIILINAAGVERLPEMSKEEVAYAVATRVSHMLAAYYDQL